MQLLQVDSLQVGLILINGDQILLERGTEEEAEESVYKRRSLDKRPFINLVALSPGPTEIHCEECLDGT